ncbi:MAG: penicillin-binding protein 2 [Deltaproteobacteria bacterium]|nr:penicillin-binding protein 2 [Deltaproteobacteria bacterium]
MKKKADKNKYVNMRIGIVGLFFFLLMTVIGIKVVYLQLFCSGWLSEKAANQYEKDLVTTSKRGQIFDRNHHAMAVSIETTSIAAYPHRLKDKKGAAARLAKILNLDRRKLEKKIGSQRSFIWVKRQTSPKELREVKALGLEGIDFIPAYSRFYPNKMLAAQVLGFTGTDGHGLEGVEYYYDSMLRGQENSLVVLKDALGRRFAKEHPDEAAATPVVDNAKNIVLTIDRTIQFIAEKALEEAIEEHSAKSGMAIVMDPETGAILAMANIPLFNPNDFGNFPRNTWRNRAITDPFEPGSTMKIFTAAAALESGRCTPSTIFYCENGVYHIGRNVIHDTHPRGWLSLQQIVKYSSNIGVVKVVETVGPDCLHRTLTGFGFGEKTKLDCPGETSGVLTPAKRWTRVDTGAISFGQGMSVSALQLVTAASAIANGGDLMRPYIVAAVTDHNGAIIQKTEPHIVGKAVSAKTAGIVKRIMETVVTEGGTGVNAALEGYTVSGKTGTAQKIDTDGTYAAGKYISSFLGFAPAKSPEVVILVVVDEPEGSHYGGTVAAPAFGKIAHETLNYLNIPPEIEKNKLRVSTGVNQG